MPRRRSGKKIDFVHWTNFTGGTASLAAGTVGVTLAVALHEPETLLRMRGEAVALFDGVQTPGNEVLVSMGIILVPEGTGTTVLWSPITDGDAPWFWYESFLIGYEEYVTDVIDCPQITAFKSVMDSKVIRRIRN